MTVKELIDKLKKNDDNDVVITTVATDIFNILLP